MSETIKDASGRRLALRDLSVLDQARLLRAAGAEQAQNLPYMVLVQAAAMVEAIDDVPVPLPTSERQIDALIGRIGDAGFAVLVAHMKRQQAAAMAAAEAILDGEEKPADPLGVSDPSPSTAAS